MSLTISVKQLSTIFEDINTGNYKPVKQINKNIWECNGLYIERDFYGMEEFTVQYCGGDIMFKTFGDAVDFCMHAE